MPPLPPAGAARTRIEPMSTMRAKIAELADLTLDRVAVKATISEKLGFTGHGECIVCCATVRLPWA